MVRPFQSILRAQRVAGSRAQIIDFDDDGLGPFELVSRRVGLGRQLPARAARGARPGARTDAKQVLRGGGVVAGVGVEAAGGGGRVAVG